MTNLSFIPRSNILCLGAHSDDIEIGCGGTILKWTAENAGLNVWWVVFGASGARRAEARASARAFLRRAGQRTVVIRNFRDGFFPAQWGAVKRFFEKLKDRIQPDVVFTHYREDWHQDHRVISELAWNTFRNHLILEYEIPKYDGDLGRTNFYVRLSEETARQKAAQICKCFQTQDNKHWFAEGTFLSLMRLRGIECGPKTRYAEGFYARKLVE
jgi:LmbE family N-acetylglucosaminyl deacetylase